MARRRTAAREGLETASMERRPADEADATAGGRAAPRGRGAARREGLRCYSMTAAAYRRSLLDMAAATSDAAPMCRLFGMTGGRQAVRATFWLLEAPDSLAQQSRREPDGTGIGWFGDDRRAHVAKQPLAAYEDEAFARAAREL